LFVSIIIFTIRPDALSLNGSVMIINQSINQSIDQSIIQSRHQPKQISQGNGSQDQECLPKNVRGYLLG
jgi:hypothetical protein